VEQPAEERRAEPGAPKPPPAAFAVGDTLRAGVALWRAGLGPLIWLAALGLLASLPL